MTYWDPNYGRPYNRGQNEFDEIFYNGSFDVTNLYVNQNDTYNQQFAQNYDVPMSNYLLQGNPSASRNNLNFTVNSMSCIMAQERGQINDFAAQERDVQAQSSTVANSTLTPLAKEFMPSSSCSSTGTSNNNSGNAYGNTFYDDRSKKRGAIKKGTYWNKDRRNRNENKHYSAGNYEVENRHYRHGNENNVTKNWEHHKFNQASKSRNNGPKDFNKSTEQNKILQDTKKFLQQVKHIEEKNTEGDIHSVKNPTEFNETNQSQHYKSNKTSDKNNKGNFYYRSDYSAYGESKFNVEPDINYKYSKYYSKGNYTRSKNYKHAYKKDYNSEFENRNRDNQTLENRSESDIKKDRQSTEKQQENVQEFDKKYYDKKGFHSDNFEKRKTQNDAFEKKKSGLHNLKKNLDAASQRERLEQLVIRRLLECLVCCEKLRHTDQVWSCKQCFHILHLQCTKRWAQSSKLEAGWRCPACQNVYQDVPKEYRCYCSKQVNPSLEPGGTPHSCGEVCGRKGRSCNHTCTLICHPGPCPDCCVMVPRFCGCGATKPIVKCSSTVPITCNGVCEKNLECELHKCNKRCHEGSCDPCNEDIKQECYCGKEGRKVKCSAEVAGATKYECGERCDKLLPCRNHRCERNCHAGPCDECHWAPNKITTCPCGQTELLEPRNSCLDPIPCCDKICNKKLLCGQPSSPHACRISCHEGACPPCLRTTLIRCRCGHMDKELPCMEVTTKADDARCEKKCTKKRLCGKHKCNQLCCIEVDHICPLSCNRLLSCGQHRCEESCHKGRCPPCWRTSFDELYCECGSSVLYPPVACGTRPPPCDQPCSRPRSCEHDVFHTCHTGPCPPCTVLTKRWCHGQHEQRSTIPCHQENFSCGLACGRDMECGKHKCIQACHAGPCRTPCTQPCAEARSVCGHPCNQPCHSTPCPDTVCKQLVQVTCQCGLRKSSRVCMELASEYQSIAMSQLASKMEQMQLGHAVDLSDIVSGQRKGSLKTLECNEDCRLVERNRRLAIGLQIRNPDLSAKLTPRYSDFMRGWAKKDSKFCQHIHDKLTELVQLAKQSKQKSRSYSFESMNRDKRHFVHEYCEHFGCESAAYDPEPNRNVVATAYKDKSWLPSYSLLEIMQREGGYRKVPGPQQLGKVGSSKSEVVSLKLPGRIARPATPPSEFVDYFHNPPE